MRSALAELSADQASQYDSRRQLIKVQTPTSMFVIARWYNVEKKAVHKTLRYYEITHLANWPFSLKRRHCQININIDE